MALCFNPWYTVWADGASGKEPSCQCRRHKRCGFYPGSGKLPWSRKWPLAPVFLPGKFHRQRSLAGYSKWCRKESDATEHIDRPFLGVVLVTAKEDSLDACHPTVSCLLPSLLPSLPLDHLIYTDVKGLALLSHASPSPLLPRLPGTHTWWWLLFNTSKSHASAWVSKLSTSSPMLIFGFCPRSLLPGHCTSTPHLAHPVASSSWNTTHCGLPL